MPRFALLKGTIEDFVDLEPDVSLDFVSGNIRTLGKKQGNKNTRAKNRWRHWPPKTLSSKEGRAQ